MRERKLRPVISSKPQRPSKLPVVRALYAKRYLVECVFHTLKRFRAIATRFEKKARNSELDKVRIFQRSDGSQGFYGSKNASGFTEVALLAKPGEPYFQVSPGAPRRLSLCDGARLASSDDEPDGTLHLRVEPLLRVSQHFAFPAVGTVDG